MGAVYLFGRVLYTLGYTTGDPSARNTRGGIIGALAYYRKKKKIDFRASLAAA
jgi:hypothetical protein